MWATWESEDKDNWELGPCSWLAGLMALTSVERGALALCSVLVLICFSHNEVLCHTLKTHPTRQDLASPFHSEKLRQRERRSRVQDIPDDEGSLGLEARRGKFHLVFSPSWPACWSRQTIQICQCGESGTRRRHLVLLPFLIPPALA